MVYVKHFDILGIETAQIPCIELQGVPNTATVGAAGLLGMDVTSAGREIYVCTKVEGAIYTWQPLKDGKDGASVIKSEINDSGELILTLSDGKVLNAGVVRGGDGVGVTNAEIIDGQLVFTLSNGKTLNVGEVSGGTGGSGVGMSDAEINDKGELVITLSDGTVKNLGKVTAENGVSITKMELNDNYELIATYSNGTSANLGSIKTDYALKAEFAERVNPYQIPLQANVHYNYNNLLIWYKNTYGEDFNFIPYKDDKGKWVYPLVPCEYGIGRVFLSREAKKGEIFSMIASTRETDYRDVFQLLCEINEEGKAADGGVAYSFYIKDYTLLHDASVDKAVETIPLVANCFIGFGNMEIKLGTVVTDGISVGCFNRTPKPRVVGNDGAKISAGDLFMIHGNNSANEVFYLVCEVTDFRIGQQPGQSGYYVSYQVMDYTLCHDLKAKEIQIGNNYYSMTTTEDETTNGTEGVITFVLEA